MTTKTFTGYRPIEAPTFTLESSDGTHRLEEVKCVGMLPGMVFLDFMAHADEDNPTEMAQAVRGLLEQAIRPEEHERFFDFVGKPESEIGMETLMELAGYLGEKYAARPTQPSPMPSPG